MRLFLALPFICTLSLALSDRSAVSRDTSSCATLHMIVARASLEAPGQGVTGNVTARIQSLIPGSDSEAVDYPATLNDYLTSEASGVSGMQTLLTAYEARCPNSKIALLGYSQGAHVVGDILCGTSETYFNNTAPQTAAVLKNIIASIQMGDPSFVLQQPQDVGNATKGGIFHRNDTAACPSSIMQSYCDFNDKYCDSGSGANASAVHASYVRVYGDAAVQWVVDKYEAVSNGTNSTSVGGTGTPSSTPSSASPTTTPITTGSADRLGTSCLTIVLGLAMLSAWL